LVRFRVGHFYNVTLGLFKKRKTNFTNLLLKRV